ncbi:MAG: DUF3800 domain-containing protein [Clostridiales Family XIII bacterium]|jgi:hypothetical protein|nr:DUF3800 domain-containing protein [Clostridiales Family XIII bacterium]
MIVLLDESGNTGIRPSPGTSPYFICGLVLFNDNSKAQQCSERISQLRNEIGYAQNYEFHFNENSDRIRRRFLDAIKPFDFQYIAVAINKFSDKMPTELKSGGPKLYNYLCGITLVSSFPYLESATLIIDKSGSKAFQTNLRKYLKRELNDPEGTKIKKYKSEESHKDNLLQLADYCVGILSRKVNNKKNWQDYYAYISKKEIAFIDLLK